MLCPILILNNEDMMVALELYQTTFADATISRMTFGETGAPVEEENKDKVMFSEIKSKTVHFMLSNVLSTKVEKGENVQFGLSTSTQEENESIFHALAKEGKIILPLAPQPFTAQFGRVQDKLGVIWNLQVEK
jgi:PhnB protein